MHNSFIQRCLLILTLVCPICLFGQPVPGFFQSDQMPLDSRYAITSSDGNIIALGTYNGYALLDVRSRAFTFLTTKRGARLSPDFNYTFGNQPLIEDIARTIYPEEGAKEARWSSWVSTATGTDEKQWRNEHYILSMDKDNNFITSKPWMIQEDGYNYIGGLTGVFLVDGKTGATLKTLRSDTLYKRKAKQMNFLHPHIQYIYSLNTLLVQPEWPDKKTILYPLDGGIPAVANNIWLEPNPYGFTENRYYYNWLNERYGGVVTYFSVTDMIGGTSISKQYKSPLTYQPDGYGPMIFGFWNGHLFRFDRENNTVYEEVAEGGDLKVLNKWKVDLKGERPSHDQQWRMAVGNGPSLFIFPILRSAADRSGSSNNAFFVDLSSGSLAMRVNPFFNPNAATLAHEQRVKLANEEYAAKQKKEADDKLAAKIKANWTDKGYVRGRTYYFGSSYVIMDSYDAEKDQYKLWQPQQRYEGKGHWMGEKFIFIPGYGFRDRDYSTRKQWTTCAECEGDGHFEYTEYTTTTKDLPWGYFSGIETKKITTKSTTTFRSCTKCEGQGVILR